MGSDRDPVDDGSAKADGSARADGSVPAPIASGSALHFVVDAEGAGERLDHLLASLAEVPRAQIQRWIEDGRVEVAGEVATRASRRLALGEAITADPPAPAAARVVAEALPLVILYEDADLIVVDKAAGMVVHPAPGHASGTLVNALLHHCADLAGVGGFIRPGIVHRLDRGTSGVMVVAKHDAAHLALSEQFRDHTIERVYRAFVRAMPSQDEGRVVAPIGRHAHDRKRMSVSTRSGRPAATRWRVVERYSASAHARLDVHPETGRTHQIRVHLASIGLPIVGDDVYGRARRSGRRGLPTLSRPALHAGVLGFRHPRSGESLRFEAAMPADMCELMEKLREREAVRRGSDPS